jgi:hypothetical protein
MTSIKTVVSDFRYPGPEYSDALTFLQEHREGRAAYSLAGRKALADCRVPLRKLFETLRPLVEL